MKYINTKISILNTKILSLKMDNLQLIERAAQDNTWVAFLFIGSFLLVVILKSFFEKQFNDFSELLYTNKYIKLYSEANLSWFSIILIVIQLISFSFFIQIILGNLGHLNKNDFISFVQIFTFLLFFISLKYLLEKSIASLFDIQEFYNRFLFQQASYKMYLGLVLLLFTFVMFYGKTPIDSITYLFTGIFIILNLVIYLISYRFFQKEIIGNLFYFILYLCTLEIAPYYFTYYWFTK